MKRTRLVPPPGLFPELERPAPAYPQYGQLVADAEAAVKADGGHVDPVKLRAVQALPRGFDWKVSVLGHDRRRTLVEMHMLLLAHERDLAPPLPQWLLDARAEADRRQAGLDARAHAIDETDRARWEEALEHCTVEVRVLRAGHARARLGFNHQLGHVVPAVDAVSGRHRLHLAGRALCETPNRAQPMDLSGGDGGPASCLSCLKYTPKIRPAG